MPRGDVKSWLSAYGQAWEQKDARAFVALFSPRVRYHWTPFEPPKEGRDHLAEAFESAVARQHDIRFDSTVLADDRQASVAHWSCSYDRVGADYRVHLDGIFQMEFDEEGLCSVFREWWHSDESAPASQET